MRSRSKMQTSAILAVPKRGVCSIKHTPLLPCFSPRRPLFLSRSHGPVL
jgi:hypothetical protein